jgi:hypothetical protein
MIMCVVSFACIVFCGVTLAMDLDQYVPIIDVSEALPKCIVSLVFLVIATVAWAGVLALMGY